MEMKDWVEVVASVIGDGLLVFIIGLHFERRAKERESQNKHIVSIISEYQGYVKDACYSLQRVSFVKEEEKGEILRKLFEDIEQKIVPCYMLHEEMLSPLSKLHNEMINCANDLLGAAKRHHVAAMNRYVNETRTCLYTLSDECDKLIHKKV